MPAFTTLADLWRANADLLIQCGGCDRYAGMQLTQLSPVERPDIMPVAMEAETIAGVVAKLKCRKCGGRVKEWWPQVRIHGDMATG